MPAEPAETDLHQKRRAASASRWREQERRPPRRRLIAGLDLHRTVV
jgi:hypothetical protein